MLKNKKIFISSPYINKYDKKFVAETLRKNEISTYGQNVLEFENKISKILNSMIACFVHIYISSL